MFSNYRKVPKWAVSITAAAVLLGSAGVYGSYADAPASAPVQAVGPVKASPVLYAAPASPQAKLNQPLHIVAVGDSLTAGYELGMTVNSIPYGYVDRIYEQALYHTDADLNNYGIIALKSSGLKELLDSVTAGKTVTAEQIQPGLSKYPTTEDIVAKSSTQLSNDLKKADLVVMTIGGNDFLSLFDEIKEESLSADQLRTRLDSHLDSYIPTLESSLRSILNLNPKATIVFADQYLPVPAPSILNKAVTEDQYKVLTDGVDKLKSMDEELAAKLQKEGSDVRLVDVSKPFLGNEFAYTYILRRDIHPKQSGYDVMGRQFADGIWGEYRDPAPLQTGAPLRVVVNGTDLAGINKPVLKNNTTFLPMRDIANALHANLAWDNKTRTATVTSGSNKVSFTIGATTMKVNGQSMPLETPAYLQQVGSNSVTYLPLAALSKGLGYKVVYRKPIATVFIRG
ncbi:lysophospholipase L1-like esterase [Paenibacillus taihuensis]|uniref:Lysophospholipase L1-like esterase n=1 Tax=Paenibacillus taihuensis TaxID=1156355 RepID=A0A3D9SMJ7_9BACL|nr:stalk domain-containing protein [Paenibacillus taihuensis]REE92784.1 lysophospholipase L1-like esterase [Paenibacillus taihuensis]